MSARDRILELLPPPYTDGGDSVLASILESFALEMDALIEDLDRLRQSHWVGTAFRMQDLEKIGDLVGVTSLPWETLPAYRARLLALVAAMLRGAVGPRDIRTFVYDYLIRIERTLDATLTPGLRRREDVDAAYRSGSADNPPTRFRPLELVENPQRARSSAALSERDGRVPFLFRWEERQGGVDDTVATFRITGYSGGRAAVPILANVSTGEFIGYAGTIPLGRTLTIAPADPSPGDADPRRPRAIGMLDGNDVTKRLFSTSKFVPGVAFKPDDLDAAPRLPRLRRGVSRWAFLSAGLFDVRGLDHYLFAMAGESIRQGAFDESFFNDALFVTGNVARVEMDWLEREPAAFEVRVPRYLIAEPVGTDRTLHEQVADGLVDTIRRLHAAGVRAGVRFVPFVERNEQIVRVRLPWYQLEPQGASAGTRDTLDIGGLFGETPLGGSRFE